MQSIKEKFITLYHKIILKINTIYLFKKQEQTTEINSNMWKETNTKVQAKPKTEK